MCGIVGYIGKKPAAPYLLDGLKKLEYRGYDSAGIALMQGQTLYVCKKQGRVEQLNGAREEAGRVGIGHTRWATHGKPSEENAHPHVSGKFALVHNGIIENDHELREKLQRAGEKFSSQTDSELIVKILALEYRGDLLAAVKRTVKQLEGAFALAILCTDYPDTIVCVRQGSPLIVGISDSALTVASDIPAIAGEGVHAYVLRDGEIALLSGEEVTFYNSNLLKIEKEETEYDVNTDSPDLCGFRHYMRKEMQEIPQAVEDSLSNFKEIAQNQAFRAVLRRTDCVQIIGCGTAYHSGIAAKAVIEAYARVPVEVCIASEYRYRNPIIGKNTLVIAVSQSGETADTLAAAMLAKERGAYLAAVTNVPYSSLTEIADIQLPTRAGREIGVAATKSYNAQLGVLYALALLLSEEKGKRGATAKTTKTANNAKTAKTASDAKTALSALPKLCRDCLPVCEEVRGWVTHFLTARSVYFIGRGEDYAVAMEGSLKLKELSYLPSEGYPAGELKHGTLALIDEKTPVVAIITRKDLAEKNMNAVHEVSSRGARVFLVTSLPEYCKREEIFESVLIPECYAAFSPMLSVIPLQSLAYYTALARGNDPDKPRNLAKSVTVE